MSYRAVTAVLWFVICGSGAVLLAVFLTTQAVAQGPNAQPILPAGERTTPQSPRLVRSQQDVFLVVGRFRRWVVSPQVFTDYRFDESSIERLAEDELTRIPRGPDLVAGPVLRAPDGNLWIVYQGTRRRIAGADAYPPLNLSPDDAVQASPALVASYPMGRAIGNPPRPWLLALHLLAAAAAIALWWRGSSWRATFIFVGFASALRLVYSALYPWTPDGPDADAYVTLARYLMGAPNLFRPDPYGGLTGVTSPAYAFILAALAPFHAVAGIPGWKLAQAGAAVLLSAATAGLASVAFGSRAGKATALVAALSPAWFYAAELIAYELWLALFLAAALWSFARSLATRHPARWLVASGALFGLAIFVQLKVAVLLVPAAIALVFVRSFGGRADSPRPADRFRWARLPFPSRRGLGGRSALPVLLLLLLPALVPTAAWGARNVAVHGELLLGSSAGGVLFWMGNHDGASGGYMQLGRPDALTRRIEQYPPTLLTREARAYSELAWDFILRHPSRFALLALAKLERFWWTISPDRLGAWVELRTAAFTGGVLDAPAILLLSKLTHVASLAAAGAGMLWGARLAPSFVSSLASPGLAARVAASPLPLVLLASLGLFWLVHAPFIAEPRHRLPILPVVQVFEGAGLALLWSALRRGVPSHATHERS
ncbi:MAG: hypothetical protein AVDCRST_MAG77-1763 [uncultured Chloroflexi bacterium]|uniref:Glycosyltransferase RgtA/B/C/D-like domain-containing protein n=1 Tax=uncultured Chloroflexota bacterium TaxID=166587 RepID=A0A6J4I6P1_9CHLR|nr:MAG: hypothetical protein AVDCRST_MAG77-1763 [uncultured Chloroflexota bacterium]